MVNADRVRAVADRINPDINSGKIAGFYQGNWGFSNDGIPGHECETSCCIAGHAYILARGRESYIEQFNAVGLVDSRNIVDDAVEWMGVNSDEANALFSGQMFVSDIQDCFDIEVDDEWIRGAIFIDTSPEVISKLLYKIADLCGGSEKNTIRWSVHD